MNYFEPELVERIKEAIIGQLALAMSRNVEYIMKDLEKSIKGDGGSDEPMKVVVKMSFWSDGPERASTKIESVAWERKLQYKDDEFPLLKIDLAQPALPGLLEQCQKIVDEQFVKEGREVIELFDKMKRKKEE